MFACIRSLFSLPRRRSFRSLRNLSSPTRRRLVAREAGDCYLHNKREHPTKISYPESSRFLVSGWSPGETLGNLYFITSGFLRFNNASCYEAADQNIFFFRLTQSLSWRPTAGQRAWGFWVRDWPNRRSLNLPLHYRGLSFYYYSFSFRPLQQYWVDFLKYLRWMSAAPLQTAQLMSRATAARILSNSDNCWLLYWGTAMALVNILR